MKIEVKDMSRWLFLLGILLSLLYIWIPEYFLTGDGPAHSYNAAVIRDMVLGKNAAFFESFYAFNNRPEPNWLSHILLAMLQVVFTAPVSEKVVLSSYILLMGFGFRYLLRQLSPGNEWLSVVGLLLLFTHPLQMGFFNSGISVAMLWWLMAFWISWHQQKHFWRWILVFFGSSLVFFTHMTGYMFWLMASGWLTMTALMEKNDLKEKLQVIAGTLFAHVLPLIWVFRFLSDRGSDISIDLSEWSLRLSRLAKMHTLITLHHTEEYPAHVAAVLFLLVIVTAIGRGIFRSRAMSMQQKALFPILLTVLLIYFLLPDWMASGGLFNIRTQYITAYFVLLTCSVVHWTSLQQRIFSIAGMLIFIWFTAVRFPVMWRASKATQEYVSLSHMIPAHSSLLPLSFQHNGLRPNRKVLADRIWLYMHVGDYYGTRKPLIILSNYEPGAGFFPLVWKHNNPFWILSQGNGGIEAQPPNANILQYETASNKYVDYILLMSEGPEPWYSLLSPLKEQLNEGYDLIAVSENKLAKLYKRKSL